MDAIVNCGGGLAEAPLWSQNLTPKHSSFSATIDSQSSIGMPIIYFFYIYIEFLISAFI